MNRTVFINCLSTLVLVSSVALAQTPQQNCQAKKDAVAAATQKAAANKADTAKISAQIIDLQKKIKELNTQKVVKGKEAREIQREIGVAKADEKKTCRLVEACEKDTAKLNELKNELNDLKKDIRKLGKEISEKKQRVSGLNTRVEGYQTKYESLGCAQLVAGQTPQATIDLCNKIFSDWNADQAAINALMGEINKAKGNARKLAGKATALRRRVIRLGVVIRKNCGNNVAVRDVDALEKEDVGIDKIITNIDSAKKELGLMKRIRIAKPKVKKAPKGKIKKAKQSAVAPKKLPGVKDPKKNPDPAKLK